MQNRHLVIHGGSSEISRELFILFKNEFEEFTIFCRNKKKVDKYIDEFKNDKLIINILEIDLLDIEKNYLFIEKIKYKISGLIWISGVTGDPEKEMVDQKSCEENIKINFLNPVLFINKLLPKIETNNNAFIVGITSVAGLRGRKKQLFYSSAKAGFITYLSGLRQKLSNKNIHVLTVIPGYINTSTFQNSERKGPSFLITSPEKSAKLIYKAIKSKKEIVYISFIWRVIMFCINLIPEKLFKKYNF